MYFKLKNTITVTLFITTLNLIIIHRNIKMCTKYSSTLINLELCIYNLSDTFIIYKRLKTKLVYFI